MHLAAGNFVPLLLLVLLRLLYIYAAGADNRSKGVEKRFPVASAACSPKSGVHRADFVAKEEVTALLGY